MKQTLLFISLAAAISGCASSPDKMQAAYVSPLQYDAYSCKQIGGELERVTRRANELYGSLKKTADNDQTQMTVGLILFWPSLFFLEGGDGPEAAEYSKLKGERDALEKVAIQKECGIKIEPAQIAPVKESSKGEEQAAMAIGK